MVGAVRASCLPCTVLLVKGAEPRCVGWEWNVLGNCALARSGVVFAGVHRCEWSSLDREALPVSGVVWKGIGTGIGEQVFGCS